MKISRKILISILMATAITTAIPLAAQAKSSGERCGGPEPHGPMAHDEFGPGRGSSMHGLLQHLQLTEAQHDQAFKILHDQAPMLREKAKEARNARAELHALTFSGKYDAAKTKALAEKGAHAMAAISEIHAAGANQVYLLLTPEQRKKAEELKSDVETRKHHHHGRPNSVEKCPASMGN